MSKTAEVLLIEDNPEDVILVEEALKEGAANIHLNVVENGEEALEFLDKERSTARKTDLIILDLNLPRENGREVLKKIKTDQDLRKIPVVVLTTSRNEKDVAESYKHGASCYITKPFGFYKFMEAVKQIQDFWLSLVTLPPKQQ